MEPPRDAEFLIKTPPRGWREDRFVTFDCVNHVAHVEDARRVADDGMIRAGLVHDESILDETRLCVVWTSPNTWVDGSLYGNVSLEIPAQAALEGRLLYFVEVMAFGVTAIRVLASSRPIRGLGEPFDPAVLGSALYRGPDSRWWRHDDFNVEIMLADDLPLDRCESMNFVHHHRRYCGKSRHDCPQLGRDALDAGKEFLAYVLGRRVGLTAGLLSRNERDENQCFAAVSLQRALLPLVPPGDFADPLDQDKEDLMRATLLCYGLGDQNAAASCLRGIGNAPTVRAAFEAILETQMGKPFAARVRASPPPSPRLAPPPPSRR